MIKVIPKNESNSELDRKLREMNIGDLIILRLQFEKEEFTMGSYLKIIELDKNNSIGKASFIDVQEVEKRKTFNKYGKFKNQTIPFKYSDICDVVIE